MEGGRRPVWDLGVSRTRIASQAKSAALVRKLLHKGPCAAMLNKKCRGGRSLGGP